MRAAGRGRSAAGEPSPDTTVIAGIVGSLPIPTVLALPGRARRSLMRSPVAIMTGTVAAFQAQRRPRCGRGIRHAHRDLSAATSVDRPITPPAEVPGAMLALERTGEATAP